MIRQHTLTIAILFVAASFSQAAIVSQFTFDDSTANDSVDGNNGTFVGGASVVSDATRGNVLSVNGTSQYTNHADAANLDITSAISLTGWFNKTDNNDGSLVVKEQTSSAGYGLEANADGLRFFLFGSSNGNLDAVGSYSNNTWNHAVGTWDGATMRAYVNGVEAASTAHTAAITTNSDPLQVGHGRISGNANNYFGGQIDDVGVYNSALTAEKVSAIHGLGKYSSVDQNDSSVDDVLTAFSGTGSATAGGDTWTYATAATLGTSGADPIGTSGGVGSGSSANVFFTLDSSGNGMMAPATPAGGLIKVDFDDATLTPGDVQFGWDGQAVVDTSVATIPITLTSNGTSAGITATLGGDSDTWESRDRGIAVTGTSFDDVVEELVATRDGGATVALTGLTVGAEYELLAWHNDPATNGFGTWGGIVTPTVDFGSVISTSLGAITNLSGAQTDDAFGITSIVFTATAANPTITLTRSGGTGSAAQNLFFPISGLQFTQTAAAPVPTPEPGTFVLAAVALFGLGFVRRRRRSQAVVVSLLCCAMTIGMGRTATAAYVDTVTAQSPLEYYRLATLTGENGDTIVQNSVLINQTTPTPKLDQSGGFSGLGGNTWGNFDGGPGATLTELVSGWNSDLGSTSFWLRLDSGSGTSQLLIGRGAGGGGLVNSNDTISTFARDNGSFGIIMDGTPTEASAGTMSTDVWHHLAYTWDRNTGAGDGEMRVYLDGAEVASTTTASWDSFTVVGGTSPGEPRFGKEITGTTRVLEGSADEIAIWTRALSAQEVQAQFNAAFIPEPTSALLGLIGLVGLSITRRGRTRK